MKFELINIAIKRITKTCLSCSTVYFLRLSQTGLLLHLLYDFIIRISKRGIMMLRLGRRLLMIDKFWSFNRVNSSWCIMHFILFIQAIIARRTEKKTVLDEYCLLEYMTARSKRSTLLMNNNLTAQ